MLLLLASGFTTYAQDIKPRELQKLRSFQIETTELNLKDSVVIKDLRSIVRLDRKNTGNKIVSISLASLSVATTILSLRTFKESKGDEEGLGQTIGSLLLVPAAIEMGIAIPVFLKSNRQKKERDRMIKKYQ